MTLKKIEKKKEDKNQKSTNNNNNNNDNDNNNNNNNKEQFLTDGSKLTPTGPSRGVGRIFQRGGGSHWVKQYRHGVFATEYCRLFA